MARKPLSIALVLAALVAASLLLRGPAAAQGPDPGGAVAVLNFPDVQPVEVRGIPSQARLVSFERETLGTGRPDNPGQWLEVGVLDSDGFGSVVLSLGGVVKGTLADPGAVVAVLVPDREPIRQAFEVDSAVLLPLSTTATLTPGEAYFASSPERLPLGFPRYRVYLYNTGARAVEANLYAYLGN